MAPNNPTTTLNPTNNNINNAPKPNTFEQFENAPLFTEDDSKSKKKKCNCKNSKCLKL